MDMRIFSLREVHGFLFAMKKLVEIEIFVNIRFFVSFV